MLIHSEGLKLLALLQDKLFKYGCHVVDNLFDEIFNLGHPGVKVIIGCDGGGLASNLESSFDWSLIRQSPCWELRLDLPEQLKLWGMRRCGCCCQGKKLHCC